MRREHDLLLQINQALRCVLALWVCLVIAERKHRVEHLPVGLQAFAVLFGRAQPGDKLGWDALAGLVMRRKARKECRIPRPLFKQLAGHLDKVPLGRDAGELHEALLT